MSSLIYLAFKNKTFLLLSPYSYQVSFRNSKKYHISKLGHETKKHFICGCPALVRIRVQRLSADNNSTMGGLSNISD